MKVFMYYLIIMAMFKQNFNYTKVKRWVQSIAIAIRIAVEKYFWRGLGVIIAMVNINNLRLLAPKLGLLSSVDSYDLENYDLPMSIYEKFQLIRSVLFLHFYTKYFLYRREWESYNWLENFIIIGSYIAVFIIYMLLSCVGLFIIPNTTFGKIIFVILIVLSYYAHHIACTTDWFDKYIYSTCYTYTSTVNFTTLKNRQFLIVSNLATRWRPKKSKKITPKDKKVRVTSSASAPQDPRLKRYYSKRLNGSHHHSTALKNQSPGDEGYLQSSRIVRPDTFCYDRIDTSAWGHSA